VIIKGIGSRGKGIGSRRIIVQDGVCNWGVFVRLYAQSFSTGLILFGNKE